MAESAPKSSIPSLYAVAELVGDPDDVVLRFARDARTLTLLYGMWVCVLGCFVLGKYPFVRIAASAVLLLGVVTPILFFGFRNPRSDRHRSLGGALLWTSAAQNVITAAITGGLHSPHTLVIFMTFSALYARYGWLPRGRASFALFCGGVLALALLPRRWAGPVLAEPWFSLAAGVAMIGTFAVHARFVGALRLSAAQAAQAALRARDELADQALSRSRELELVGSRLSHELKNPLAAIKALVQLTHRAASEPVIQKQLGVVGREVDRMAAVLQSHLGFTRPFDRVDRVELDFGDLADSVLALMEGRARSAGVALQRRGDARGAVDAQRIRGALVNLVANAIEACPARGLVEIAIEDDGTTARFAVTDTGAGMPPEIVEHVGTPFFTTRERGTGLGVALARAAFEQHGGTLEYRSTPGEGTTAIGSLPRA
ncbi:MAG TPA: HAMP domain-containing sensor histidine kinase [Anaeromyxobacteraceae bacterium]|jgi:signal transduction histidine kinase|nr:HAMP domain-containing sensor histidine kinase [Anaeromyxobacteraceae bacterium]